LKRRRTVFKRLEVDQATDYHFAPQESVATGPGSSSPFSALKGAQRSTAAVDLLVVGCTTLLALVNA